MSQSYIILHRGGKNEKDIDDNKTVGIIICKQDNECVIK